jgi:hypothetical protein
VRDVACIERVPTRANRGGAIAPPGERRLFRRDDRAQCAGQIRLPEQLAGLGDPAVRIVRLRRPLVLFRRLSLAHEEVVQELVHRKAIGQLDRRLHDLLEAHRALGFEREGHGIHHGGNRRAEWTVARYEAAHFEQIRRCRFGRRALPVDYDDLPRLRVVDHRRHFTAEPEVRDLADGGGEHRRHARVDRVAALIQHPDAGGHRIMTSGRDDAVCAANLGPHGFTAPRRNARRLLRRQRGRGDQRGDHPKANCHMRLIV